MKNQKLLIVLVISILFTSCKKEDPAQLNVNTNYINFLSNALSIPIKISNTGDKELEWHIDENIEWLNVSRTNGKIDAHSQDVITLTATNYYEPDIYSSDLIISSNGGNKTISVEMNLDFTPKIFPGVGIDGTNINDAYSSIKDQYGEPDEIITSYIESIGMYEHIALYNTFAIGFYFYNTNSVIIINDNSVTAIALIFPYRGVTIKNIGIDTPFHYVNYCYGKHDEIFEGGDYVIYSYYSIGVDFLRYESKVGLIFVYTPFNNKSYSLSKSTGTQDLFTLIKQEIDETPN